MSDHASTLERLHSFEQSDKNADSAFWAVVSLWFLATELFQGDLWWAAAMALSASYWLITFDDDLSEAHCEYTTL